MQVSHTFPFKTQSFHCCFYFPYTMFASVHQPAQCILTMCKIKPGAFVFITQRASPVVSTLTHTCCYHSQRRLKDCANDTDISEHVCRAYTPDLGSAQAIATHSYTGNTHFNVLQILHLKYRIAVILFGCTRKGRFFDLHYLEHIPGIPRSPSDWCL